MLLAKHYVSIPCVHVYFHTPNQALLVQAAKTFLASKSIAQLQDLTLQCVHFFFARFVRAYGRWHGRNDLRFVKQNISSMGGHIIKAANDQDVPSAYSFRTPPFGQSPPSYPAE
jgi:hypothetical protein